MAARMKRSSAGMSRPASVATTLRADRPYERVNITGVTGVTDAQKVVLKALGAVEDDDRSSKATFRGRINGSLSSCRLGPTQ